MRITQAQVSGRRRLEAHRCNHFRVFAGDILRYWDGYSPGSSLALNANAVSNKWLKILYIVGSTSREDVELVEFRTLAINEHRKESMQLVDMTLQGVFTRQPESIDVSKNS